MDRTEAAISRIEDGIERGIDQAYARRVQPVLRRHRKTLRRYEQLKRDGKMASARRLVKASGLMDELVAAISAAGEDAAVLIRTGMTRIREAVDEDAP